MGIIGSIDENEFKYQSGFGNYFSSEAITGALPIGHNSPQKPAFGLYAEQLSGTAFTALNGENQKTWLYRILPSVVSEPFRELNHSSFGKSACSFGTPINPMRWSPEPAPNGKKDFIDGLTTVLRNGSVGEKGCAVHLYSANRNMDKRSFFNCDGGFLLLPQNGSCVVKTELGRLLGVPGEVLSIPRGMKFGVDFTEGGGQGYLIENFGRNFELPYRGPIGANGLANERDFFSPEASFQDSTESYEIVCKSGDQLFEASQDHSPYDVVAWHGNYVPFKYDLSLFNTMGTVSFDHPDPSIFTVLTSPSERPGFAACDFVIFPPRWMVAEETFRPPYFHRNIMSEYMGLIHGVYDAKTSGSGFLPGGGSLHNCMSAHGPESEVTIQSMEKTLTPEKYDNTLAFMVESCYPFEVTKAAAESENLQKDYHKCWQGLPRLFKEK